MHSKGLPQEDNVLIISLGCKSQEYYKIKFILAVLNFLTNYLLR